MAGFPTSALYLKIVGKLATVQGWSTGLWINFFEAGPITPADMDTYLEGLVTAVEAWASAVGANWTTDVEVVSLDGAYFLPGVVASSVVGSVPCGGAGEATLAIPAYCSLVASMETAHSGRSYRGRSYAPLTAASSFVGVTHEVSEGVTIAVANAYATLIEFINGYTPDSPLVGGVVSVGSRSKGALTAISSVRVDSRPDTQRRREDKLGALFTNTAVITA